MREGEEEEEGGRGGGRLNQYSVNHMKVTCPAFKKVEISKYASFGISLVMWNASRGNCHNSMQNHRVCLVSSLLELFGHDVSWLEDNSCWFKNSVTFISD